MVQKIRSIAASCIFVGIFFMKMFFVMPRGSCRFSPTCSEYAKKAIESLPLHKAMTLIIGRIFRCHPFSAGGYDPLPEDGCKVKG